MPILMFSGDVSSDVFRGYCLKWIKASYKHCKRLKQKFADVLQNSCSYKFRKFDRKTLVLESLLNIVAGLKACNFIKETQTQVFLCEICEFFFKNTSFYRSPPAAAFEKIVIRPECKRTIFNVPRKTIS